MKFTSEDLMKVMGLKVGDMIEADMGTIKATFEVRNDFTLLRLDNIPIHNARTSYDLWDILGLDYKILPQPKRVGDLKCKDFKCNNCPLRALITCNSYNGRSKRLFDNLAKWTNEYTSFDQEIYNLLKARLDKEVKENGNMDTLSR